MPHVDDVAALREEAHDVRHFDGLSLDNPSSVDELPHRLEVARRYSWTSRSLGMTSVVHHGELAPADADADVVPPKLGDARPSMPLYRAARPSGSDVLTSGPSRRSCSQA